MKRTLNKWQQLNLRGGGGSSTAAQTPAVSLAFSLTTAPYEATVPYAADWFAVIPEVTVYRDGIEINKNQYSTHAAEDHVRLVFRSAGDYVVKVRA